MDENELRNAPGRALEALPVLLEAVANGANRAHLVHRILALGLTEEEGAWLMDWLRRH
jgi:hypothetical protein